jgi:CelD/BcsL family acetyltransferase involved in cellulose biosynthesis
LSDFHGVIARPGLGWSAAQLLRACRVRAWDFDHLLAGQSAFQSYHHRLSISPYIDLSAGFDAWCDERVRSGSMLLRQTLRKARKCERECGPVRLVPHSTDPAVFESLRQWKSAQYHRTETTDVFSFPWTVRLLESILDRREETFSGVLSALYVGDRLAAVHLGMRSRGVLHWWFPAYLPDLGKYSPGLMLLVEMARAAAAEGVRRIDLGKGHLDYKGSFMSGGIAIAEGCASVLPWVARVKGCLAKTRRWLRTSPLGAPARMAARWTRSLRGRLAFR